MLTRAAVDHAGFARRRVAAAVLLAGSMLLPVPLPGQQLSLPHRASSRKISRTGTIVDSGVIQREQRP